MDGLRNLSQYGRDSPNETEDDGEAPGSLSHGVVSDSQINDGDDYSSDGSQRSIELGGERNSQGHASDFDTDFRAIGNEKEEQQRAAIAERNERIRKRKLQRRMTSMTKIYRVALIRN